MTTQIRCNWVNKGMTSLSLKGDDAPLKGKHRYLLWAFPAAFQPCVNVKPKQARRGRQCHVWLIWLMSCWTLKWQQHPPSSLRKFRPVGLLLVFVMLTLLHGREQNAHSPHESCIMTSCYPATETVWQHSFIKPRGKCSCAEMLTRRHLKTIK